MNKYKLVEAILQAVCAVILIVISFVYLKQGRTSGFAVFLVVGVIFLIMPARTLYKLIKQKKEDKKDGSDKK